MAGRARQDQHGMVYGLNLHFVINHKGQIMALKITPGNTADSTVLDEMTRHLAGKLMPTRATSAANCSANSGGVACTSSPASDAT